MRVIIIGDSLILHHPAHYNSIHDTYGFILKKYLSLQGKDEIFIIMPRSGNNTNNTKYQSKPRRIIYDIIQYQPDIVIVHLGIVDCAPRLFTQTQRDIISSLPIFMRRKIIRFLSKHRYGFTKVFQKVYVEINEFKKNYQTIIEAIIKNGAIPIIINILKPSEDLIHRSFNFDGKVRSYNKILLEISKKYNINLIDLYSLISENPELRWKDGIHLSSK
ncbi:MAG: SGNH/GDSL hydrolase family protein [Promethearchaeota archaeon]